MTIQNQVSTIFEHPFLKQAVRNYVSGNDKDLKHVFSEVFIHTYLTVSQNCGRAFRLNKWATHPVIYSAIKEVEPPTNLDVRLPIPEPYIEPVCKVVSFSIKRHVKPKFFANQLQLFSEIETPLTLLQEA